MQTRILILSLLTLLSSIFPITSAAAVEKRFTRSKIDQFLGAYCHGNGKDSNVGRVSSNINVSKGACIDIDGRTHSIFLARGTGLIYRRNMLAYAATGCPDTERIEQFYEHDSGSACMSVDNQMLGVPGSGRNNGRIMSVKFTGV